MSLGLMAQISLGPKITMPENTTGSPDQPSHLPFTVEEFEVNYGANLLEMVTPEMEVHYHPNVYVPPVANVVRILLKASDHFLTSGDMSEKYIVDNLLTSSDFTGMFIYLIEIQQYEQTSCGCKLIIEPIDFGTYYSGFEIKKILLPSSTIGVGTAALINGGQPNGGGDGNGCTNVDWNNQTENSTDGTIDLGDSNYNDCASQRLNLFTDLNNVSVYPNPASDRIFLRPELTEINNVRIMNITGQEMTNEVSMRQSADEVQINISTLKTGIYFLEIETTEGVEIQKISVR